MALHFVHDDASSAGVGDLVALTGAEAHHASSVRRVRVGERVTLTDGRGAWLDGEVAEAQPKRVDVRILAREVREAPSRRILLAQALAKGDRDELAVQAATELGIDGIVPWQASRSVSRWHGPKAEKGRARWAAIVREAAKQAHRAWIPEVEPVRTTAELASRAVGARIVVLDPWTDARLSLLGDDGGDMLLVVGPEGGIADEELAAFDVAGATRARLGDSVLRTSTAGPAAIAVLSAALGRW
ncbi:16S rRNA (uracil(1498)-N(3))-methyltransferase [Microbacterium karelineae]|uniref:16S rRNA (uracil(1498)-N(3))-methyltransferase n=1 Tax=Microbacterium karelineae TaxID=2654283 RepID=UPI0012EACC9F|nr:16S rRNA (uracil(1498)-N(3))-methyltransferase [Microbacterium karelineae]